MDNALQPLTNLPTAVPRKSTIFRWDMVEEEDQIEYDRRYQLED
jgi:hypothetical protein